MAAYGPLAAVEGKNTAESYIKRLTDELLPEIRMGRGRLSSNRIVKKGLSLPTLTGQITRIKGETPPKRALLALFLSITKPFRALRVLICHRSSESAALIFLGRWAL